MYCVIVGISMLEIRASDVPPLRSKGRLVIVGLALGTLPVSFFGLPYGAEVATSGHGDDELDHPRARVPVGSASTSEIARALRQHGSEAQ